MIATWQLLEVHQPSAKPSDSTLLPHAHPRGPFAGVLAYAHRLLVALTMSPAISPWNPNSASCSSPWYESIARYYECSLERSGPSNDWYKPKASAFSPGKRLRFASPRLTKTPGSSFSVSTSKDTRRFLRPSVMSLQETDTLCFSMREPQSP